MGAYYPTASRQARLVEQVGWGVGDGGGRFWVFVGVVWSWGSWPRAAREPQLPTGCTRRGRVCATSDAAGGGCIEVLVFGLCIHQSFPVCPTGSKAWDAW